MEELSNYNFREFRYAVWFFRMIAAIMISLLLLIIFLKINETVAIDEAEIIASNPQIDAKAPFEGQLVKVYVVEGQYVKSGDTLLSMENRDMLLQYAKKNAEITYLRKRIESFPMLVLALQRKKSTLAEDNAINARRNRLEISRLLQEMKTLDEGFEYEKERLSSAAERYIADSILYKKDMLSKSEFNNTKDATLVLKEKLTGISGQKQKQLTEKILADNSLDKGHNDFRLREIEMEEHYQALMQSKIEFESQLLQALETSKQMHDELAKQVILAPENGTVNFIFNRKQTSNIIAKSELLISMAPENISYYVRAIIPQKDIRLLRTGLDARLKLDAYSQFEYGMIKGKLSYIAERKENEKFFALIQLPPLKQLQLKSGYAVRGEIIIHRLPLYRYFIKKLFRKFEQ